MYGTVNELINDAVSFYNDTNAIDYVVPESTKRRILHYIQRTVNEIWAYRPWNFKICVYQFTFSLGEGALPHNFATVGPKGGLYDSRGLPWTEVDIQEILTLRRNSALWLSRRVFSVGQIANSQGGNLGEGTIPVSTMSLFIPDTTNTEQFNLHYEGTPPRAGWDAGLDAYDYTQPPPLPEGFHNTLLLGTIAKLQESKGDPRPAFRSEFVASLAQAAAQHLPLTSKMQQLPRAIPGGQW